MNAVRRITVEESDGGTRLDVFLAGELETSRSAAARLIGEGSVVGSGKIKASRVVRPGDVFDVAEPPFRPVNLTPQNVPFDVLYRDSWLVVIDKPAGLAVHPGAGRPDGTLANGLLFRFGSAAGDANRPGIVHRLDLGTSGLMVVALTEEALRQLQGQFARREVQKIYLALCHGCPPADEGRIDAPIGRSRHDRLKMAISESGRRAVTNYRILWSRGGLSLLTCHIETGRTHQIRVHLASLGCFLDGDRLYGPKDPQRHILQDRVFLHSWRLAFRHPESGEQLAFCRALSDDLRAVLYRCVH